MSDAQEADEAAAVGATLDGQRELSDGARESLVVGLVEVQHRQHDQRLAVEHLRTEPEAHGTLQRRDRFIGLPHQEGEHAGLLQPADVLRRDGGGLGVGLQGTREVALLDLHPTHDVVGIAEARLLGNQAFQGAYRLGQFTCLDFDPREPELGPGQRLRLLDSLVEGACRGVVLDAQVQFGADPRGV